MKDSQDGKINYVLQYDKRKGKEIVRLQTILTAHINKYYKACDNRKYHK